MDSPLTIQNLGRIAYQPALELQLQLVEAAKVANDDQPTLLLLEHDPPVITLGRRGQDSDILLPRDRIAQMGVEIFESSRGGEVTYHGPGQLVGYAIIQLKKKQRSVRSHVHHLEEAIIRTLAEYDIAAGRKEGFTGVWVGEEKIAAIGVAVERWVTYHGFALNVNTNMTHFDIIVPCGIRDKGVTSMKNLLGREVNIEEIKARVAHHFADVYDLSTAYQS